VLLVESLWISAKLIKVVRRGNSDGTHVGRPKTARDGARNVRSMGEVISLDQYRKRRSRKDDVSAAKPKRRRAEDAEDAETAEKPTAPGGTPPREKSEDEPA
jgi:hypothetical protein